MSPQEVLQRSRDVQWAWGQSDRVMRSFADRWPGSGAGALRKEWAALFSSAAELSTEMQRVVTPLDDPTSLRGLHQSGTKNLSLTC